MDSRAGGVLHPYPIPPSSPGEHSNFGYGSEDASASESGSYAGYGFPASGSSGRSGMTDTSSADPDLREYRSETPRRPGGFRRTPVSEEEERLALTHLAQQLFNPTPRSAIVRPGAQQPILPESDASNHARPVIVGQGGSSHLCPPHEVRKIIQDAADALGITLSSCGYIIQVLDRWAARGSGMAGRLLEAGPRAWFVAVGKHEQCPCGRWGEPIWWDSGMVIGSEFDIQW